MGRRVQTRRRRAKLDRTACTRQNTTSGHQIQAQQPSELNGRAGGSGRIEMEPQLVDLWLSEFSLTGTSHFSRLAESAVEPGGLLVFLQGLVPVTVGSFPLPSNLNHFWEFVSAEGDRRHPFPLFFWSGSRLKMQELPFPH